MGRAVGRPDLGLVFARVTANAPGSPVYTVNGYRPSFRLAASRHGRLQRYEVSEAQGALAAPVGPKPSAQHGARSSWPTW